MKRIIKALCVLTTLVIALSTLVIVTFAHNLIPWANRFTKSAANSTYSFAIGDRYHINGKTAYYYWDTTNAKNLFQSYLTNGANLWGGMINIVETSSSSANVKISYSPEVSSAYIAELIGGDSHFGTNVKAELVIGNITTSNWPQVRRNTLMAHELGHLWGIDDLYRPPNPKTNLESIYSDIEYYYTAPTRHDKNAMYICLNDPWYQDTNGSWKRWKSPGTFATNEWCDDSWFNSSGYWVSGAKKITFNANGGTNPPAAQAKIPGSNTTLTTAKPTMTSKFTITFHTNGGDMQENSQKSITPTFNSWNTSFNGTGTTYLSGGAYSTDAAVTLYAQWRGTAGDLDLPVRENYMFAGWYTSQIGGEKVTENYIVKSDLDLYAQWSEYGIFYIQNATTNQYLSASGTSVIGVNSVSETNKNHRWVIQKVGSNYQLRSCTPYSNSIGMVGKSGNNAIVGTAVQNVLIDRNTDGTVTFKMSNSTGTTLTANATGNGVSWLTSGNNKWNIRACNINPLGDVDRNKIIQIFDFNEITQYLVNINSEVHTAEGFCLADINRDGVVNILDGIEILMHLTGMPSELTSFIEQLQPTFQISPIMISNTAPSPYKVTAKSSWGSGYEPYRAFNGNWNPNLNVDADYWASSGSEFTNGVGQTWLQIDLGEPKMVDKLSFQNGFIRGNVKHFRLLGSNNGTSFTTLYEKTDVPKDTNFTSPIHHTFDFNNKNSYRYYRIEILKNHGDGGYVGIGQIELISRYGVRVSPFMTSNTTPSPYKVTAHGNLSTATYQPWKAFDGNWKTDLPTDSDYWWSGYGLFNNTTGIGEAWIQIDLGEQRVANKVHFQNGFSRGLARDIQLQGSNNGTSFTNLISLTDIPEDTDIYNPKKYVYKFNNTTAYRYYRFKILRVYYRSGTSQGQQYASIGQLELWRT